MRKIVWLFAVILSLGLTSCIDILDEIKLNSDKSGSVFIGIESQLLGTLFGLANQHIPQEAVDSVLGFPQHSKAKLDAIEGVNDVKAFNQLNEGRFGISFKFDDPKALNKAYYSLFEMKYAWYYPNIVKIRKHSISRRNLTPQLIKQIEQNSPNIKDSEYLKYLNIKTIIELPKDAKWLKTENPKEEINSNKIIIRYPLTEVLQEEKSTSYKIHF